MKIWDTSSGTCRGLCPHGDSVVALRWHSTLPMIATAALDNIVRIWDARTSSCILQLTGHYNLVTNLEMVPLTHSNTEGDELQKTDVVVSVSDDGTARVFHIAAPVLMADYRA
jgi:WD40 repeat protein